MQLYVRTLSGKTLVVTIGLNDSILNIKQIIQDKEGIPPDQQRLTCHGKQLDDQLTIKDANIPPESTIQLFLYFHGPCSPPSVATLCSENLISTLPSTNIQKLGLATNDLMNMNTMVCQEFLDDLNTPFLLIFHHDPNTDPSLVTTDSILHRKSAGEYLSSGLVTIMEENSIISTKPIGGPRNYYNREGIVPDYLVPVIPPTQQWKPDTNYVIRLSLKKSKTSCVGEWVFRSLPSQLPLYAVTPTPNLSLDPLPLRSLCIVCLQNFRNAVFVHNNTGHTCCCLGCAEELFQKGMACPICRESIDQVIQNFT